MVSILLYHSKRGTRRNSMEARSHVGTSSSCTWIGRFPEKDSPPLHLDHHAKADPRALAKGVRKEGRSASRLTSSPPDEMMNRVTKRFVTTLLLVTFLPPVPRGEEVVRMYCKRLRRDLRIERKKGHFSDPSGKSSEIPLSDVGWGIVCLLLFQLPFAITGMGMVQAQVRGGETPTPA